LTAINEETASVTKVEAGGVFVAAAKEEQMLAREIVVSLAVLLMGVSAYGQSKLLLDPAQAPITLRGGWEKKQGPAGHSGNHGDIAVKISKINPDGTFEGRLDFFSSSAQPWCRAVDEPIKEGRITAKGLTFVASGGPPATCGMMTLDFRLGQVKYLQGRVKSEAGGGSSMWLDAPK
jgi:hypothetical protein